MNEQSRVYIAGHRGLVGSAIFRKLNELRYDHIITASSEELDLRDREAATRFFQDHRPEYVFLAAAKVGGIQANYEYPADFIFDNVAIQTNVIDLAKKYDVKKLLFLGSSCIYPKYAPQSIKEEYLLTGALEPTNEPYAIAKITGLKMCEAYNRQYGTNFLAVMPTNLYGINDNFDLHSSHVLPALIRKFHEAKQSNSPFVEVWGTGTPLREFLYADDLADACVFLMKNYSAKEIGNFVNVGVGVDLSIANLAYVIKSIVGYDGDIKFNANKPDGTPRKLLDVSRMSQLGWKASTSIEVGISKVYQWFIANYCE